MTEWEGAGSAPCMLKPILNWWTRRMANGKFSMAKRMAQAGDWDGAANIWREATNSTSGKVAGRACYNMAIISEINGDLNGALQWARKAYEVYRTPYALNFVNILQQRQSNDAVLKSQTELTSNP